MATILNLQEQLNPIAHLQKYELVKGDAAKTIPEYFNRHPETLVSLAVLDFDIYEPTKIALEAIRPRLFKGSVLVFDELCDDRLNLYSNLEKSIFDLGIKIGLSKVEIYKKGLRVVETGSYEFSGFLIYRLKRMIKYHSSKS